MRDGLVAAVGGKRVLPFRILGCGQDAHETASRLRQHRVRVTEPEAVGQGRRDEHADDVDGVGEQHDLLPAAESVQHSIRTYGRGQDRWMQLLWNLLQDLSATYEGSSWNTAYVVVHGNLE